MFHTALIEQHVLSVDLCVLDCNSHTVQSVHLDHDVLLRLFTTSTERSTKLALLQYAVTGLRDVALISSVCTNFCVVADIWDSHIGNCLL